MVHYLTFWQCVHFFILKRGANLSLNDIGFNNDLKMDFGMLNDETTQFQSRESDCGVLEVAKSDPGPGKYQSDHCNKLMVECKAIIGMYISKGYNLDRVDYIQICGLEIIILNLTLAALKFTLQMRYSMKAS